MTASRTALQKTIANLISPAIPFRNPQAPACSVTFQSQSNREPLSIGRGFPVSSNMTYSRGSAQHRLGTEVRGTLAARSRVCAGKCAHTGRY